MLEFIKDRVDDFDVKFFVNEPHIHIKYNEYSMSMTFDGNILGGKLPNKQRKLVDAWVALHEDEIRAAWHAYNQDGELIKIKGLE